MKKTIKTKKLTLAQTTLRVLSANDLRAVVGGASHDCIPPEYTTSIYCPVEN